MARTVAFGVVGVLFASCSPARDPHPTPQPPAARSVEVRRAELRPMERTLLVTGHLAAREHATLSTKVAGRLARLEVDLGSPVQAGDALAQIEPRDFELRLQQATAALAQARATLGLAPEGDDDRVDLEQTTTVRRARAVFEDASRTRDRWRGLSDAGIAPTSDLDAAESAYAVAREQHAAAREEVRVRQATLAQRRAEFEIARQALRDTVLRAPFAGIVQSRPAQLGEYLAAGTRVLTLVQTDPLRLRVEIPEREATPVRPGLAVRFTVEGDPRAYTGTLARISPALAEENRMLVVEADIPNPAGLRPGWFVRGQLILNSNEPATAVPEAALLEFAGLEKIVTIQDGKALERTIATGRRGAGWIEVLAGVKEGELVILEPGGLRTGQPVQVQATPTPAPTAAAR